MAASARGLSPTDLTAIGEAITAGRRPKVVFTSSAGQMAGNAGQVVRLTDPAASEEWIVVRFGRDELPFAPADLAMPVRATPVRASAAPRTATTTSRATAPEPPTKDVAPNSAAPRNAAPKQAEPNDVESKSVGPKDVVPKAVPMPRKEPPRSKTPASLVVTLTYVDRQWTIAASQGSRALAKRYPIKPTEALRMVALIDVPGVHDAVEGIIAAERADAQTRALRLRAELAEIESRLAELTGRD